jgi:hypothetical protein
LELFHILVVYRLSPIIVKTLATQQDDIVSSLECNGFELVKPRVDESQWVSPASSPQGGHKGLHQLPSWRSDEKGTHQQAGYQQA